MGSAAGAEDLLPEAADLVHSSVAIASNPGSTDGAAVAARMCAVLNRYLEQPALLDRVLPRVVPPLAAAALEPRSPPRHSVFLVLYTVAKVRGPKHVTRLLPHEPSTFRDLTKMVSAAAGRRVAAHWETHYFLLLWLSAAVLVPFPLLSIVPEAAVDGLYEHALGALVSTSKVSDGAATLLAAFLTRKDAGRYLRDFVGRCVSGDGTRGPHGPAAAAALARIFKTGRRAELAAFVPPLIPVVGDLVDEAETGGMKLHAKLVQRMALVFLREHACAWRYDRGSRLLFGADGGAPGTPVAGGAAGSVGKVGEDAAADGGEWIEPAEEDIVEQVVESLLRALRHRDTVVRWSAAKGVGRITGRLPREHAEDVVQAVVDLFTSPSMARADSAWHGGCLALAELARRGLILPATPHFDALFGVVRSAAAFDVRRGAHSVGAHVRDAACYAVWALSRAYTTADVAPHALDIAETMIPVALLDREVNCRRAAAAAVQECVGRLSRGVIVEGVELVTLVDYFSLGDRVAAYTRIAPAVASLAGGLYFACILDELWAGKLVHWDVAIRRLAARALAALAPLDARRVLVTAVFPRLLQVAVQRGDAMHRHGAVLGLAELTLALGQSIPEQLRGSLRAVPGRMGARGYYKGRVGDLMQAAACRLIEACARADIGVDSTDAALSILEHALAAGNGELDAVAVSAYKQLCLGAAPGDAVCDRIVRGLTASSSPVELRRGFALAAGALGDRLATPAVYSHLVDALVCHGDVGVRRNAAISLGRLTPVREARLARDIALACVAGMGDYAVDERGDVGSWVREVSMEAFASLVESSVGVLDDAPCLAAVKAVVCQSCERIGRTRDVAGATLARLIAASPAGLRRTDAALRRIGAAATDARTLLTLDDVWRAALTGVVTSCAGGTAARRWAMDCIRAHAAALGAQDLVSFGDALVSMVAGDVERLVVPAMAALEFLVRDGVFNGCGAFLLRAAAAARATWKGRLRDMPRVAAAVNLLCELAVVGAGTRRPSLEALVVVLAGPVPRLRRLSAEGLYVALVADAGRAVLDMIADTPWEHLPVGDVRAARGRLCDLLDIAPPGSPAP